MSDAERIARFCRWEKAFAPCTNNASWKDPNGIIRGVRHPTYETMNDLFDPIGPIEVIKGMDAEIRQKFIQYLFAEINRPENFQDYPVIFCLTPAAINAAILKLISHIEGETK